MTQKAEGRMIEAGRARYLARLSRLRDRSMMEYSRPGSKLAELVVRPLEEAIEAWLQEAHKRRGRQWGRVDPIVREVGALECAAVTACVTVNCAGLGSNMRDAATTIGRRLEYRQLERFFAVRDRQRWQWILSQRGERGFAWAAAEVRKLVEEHPDAPERWPNDLTSRLGMFLVSLCAESVPLITIEGRSWQTVGAGMPSFKGTRTIVLDHELQEWLADELGKDQYLKPFRLPLDSPPLDWRVDGTGGGYLSDILARSRLCGGRELSGLAVGAKSDLSRVVAAANRAQRVGWRLNRDLLEVQRAYRVEGLEDILPGLEDPDKPRMPSKRANEGTWKLWRRRMAEWYGLVHERRKQRDLITRSFQGAEMVEGREPFYFAAHADARGRLYYEGSSWTPQGTDLQRSLLLFDKVQPFDVNWLAVHLANLWGVKGNLEERRAWVAENQELIRQSGAEPRIQHWWTGAGDPWKFLAACMEWARPTGRLPVQIDATSSGLQLIAICMRDRHLAEQTNVIGWGRSDIYEVVADRVTRSVRAAAESEDEETRYFATAWLAALGGRVGRSDVKRTVMTIPYAKSKMGAYQDAYTLIEEMTTEGRQNFRRPTLGPAARWLGAQVWDATIAEIPAAMEFLKWFRKVARMLTAAGHPITWTTLSGIQTIQARRRFKRHGQSMRVGTRTVSYGILENDGDELHAAAQARAIAANFIQSIDASVLHRVTELLVEEGVPAFGLIHDCVMVPSGNAQQLLLAVHQAYRETLVADPLNQFADELPITVPRPPVVGDLDVDSVRIGRHCWT